MSTVSPKSRGRKPKAKPTSARTRPSGGRRTDPFDDALLARTVRDVGRELAGIDDVLDAELCVSALLGTWWNLFLVDADPEVVLGERLVAVAARKRTTAALALLRLVAVLGTARQRAAAAPAAEALAEKGVAEPSWVADLAQPGRLTSIWAYGDVYGDQTSVLLGVERAGIAHGLIVLVDHTLGGIAKDAFVTPDPVDTLRDVRSLAEPTMWIRELTPEDAATLLVPAFTATDEATDPPVGEEFGEVRALISARLRLLPDAAATTLAPVGPAQQEEIVAEFLASDIGRGLAGFDAPIVAACARLIVEHSVEIDGRPLRVGPAKIEVLLTDRLPDVDLDDACWEAMPAVVRAWVAWAGRQSGLSATAQETLEEIVDDLADSFDPDLSLDGTDHGDDGLPPGLADAVLDGLLDGDVTPEQMQETITRRVFATPRTTAVIDGERMHLDPSDPDQRGMLIRAEHPEYADALDDTFFDTTEDGVNPRLHIAVHEIVANQLWDGEPAEVWPAALRLLDSGMDRHDVLHALAEVATNHVHAALTGRKHHDPAAYAADLAALGAPTRRRRRSVPAQEGPFDEPSPATVTPLRPRRARTGTPAREPGTTLQLKVTLRGVKPPVWRRLVVPANTTLAQLHEILQVAMGWLDGHLHQFVAGNKVIGPSDLDADPGQLDEATIRLDEVIRRKGDKIRYDYDFGDGWEHDILLESVDTDPVAGVTCTAGRRACPPEDCGGPWGYAELLDAVADPDHPDHAERVEWAGPYFDPATFDRTSVNRRLATFPT